MKNMQDEAWTPERLERLIKLSDSNMSYGEIAKELGVTRGSVSGKLRRLNDRLKKSGKDVRTRAEIYKARRITKGIAAKGKVAERGKAKDEKKATAPALPRPLVVQLPPPAIPSGAAEAILAIRDSQCHWPMGDVRDPDFHFCGAQVVVEEVVRRGVKIKIRRSYCAKHRRMSLADKQPKGLSLPPKIIAA